MMMNGFIKPSRPDDSDESTGPSPTQKVPPARRIWDYLQTDIDTKACDYVSVYACFLTGMTGCLSFSACFVWCAIPF